VRMPLGFLNHEGLTRRVEEGRGQKEGMEQGETGEGWGGTIEKREKQYQKWDHDRRGGGCKPQRWVDRDYVTGR